MARSTGLGRLEGGEVVLVPEHRVAEVVQRCGELLTLGVALLVLAGDGGADQVTELQRAGPPAAFIPAGTDLLALREEIEHFITRRRRDLFAWEGELHRALFDAAVAGASLGDLVDIAARLSGAIALIDRGGDLELRPRGETIPADVAAQIRGLAAMAGSGRLLIERAPYVLASPVIAGTEVRGVVALVGVDDRMLDEHESTVVTMASACAISLSREPVTVLPPLGDLLANPPDGLFEGAWTATAFRCPASFVQGFKKAFESEMDARLAATSIGLQGTTPVALSAVDERFGWEGVVAAVGRRLGAVQIAAGVSRPQHDTVRPTEAVRQALEALGRGTGQVTRFESVELDSLLGSLEGGDSFVRSRLGPLLDETPGSRELVHTLAAYLRTGRNAMEASVVLAVHRNTLTYRLRRITDLLEIDWKDADTVFALDLALRLLERGVSRREGTAPRSR
jgi:hypothetical protein